MSDSALLKKLNVKPGQRLIMLNPPEGYLARLEPLPEGVEQASTLEGNFDLLQLFVKNQAELAEYAPKVVQAAKPKGFLWIAYPKRSSKIETDLSRDVGWEAMRQLGWEGVTLISIDDNWSCFRFRPKELVSSTR
jgi:hypothetical protein